MSSRGVNKVIIIGNIGQDPETRYLPDGGAVTNASIATSEVWKDKQTGEQKERTEWHSVVFMDRGNYKLGEIAGRYLTKGAKVFVEGQLRTRNWDDKQTGEKKYKTEIMVSELQMLSPKDEGQPRQQGPAKQAAPAPAQDLDKFDDSIPF